MAKNNLTLNFLLCLAGEGACVFICYLVLVKISSHVSGANFSWIYLLGVLKFFPMIVGWLSFRKLCYQNKKYPNLYSIFSAFVTYVIATTFVLISIGDLANMNWLKVLAI